jgi:hypothetical protein
MMYFAIGLAVLGTAIGLVFQWKVLLPIILLVPCAVVIFSVFRGTGLQDAVITVLVAEAILQSSYFLGLLLRFIAAASSRWIGASGFLPGYRVPKADEHSPRPAPSAEVGKKS